MHFSVLRQLRVSNEVSEKGRALALGIRRRGKAVYGARVVKEQIASIFIFEELTA